MAALQQVPSSAVEDSTLRSVLRHADLTWKRAGVVVADRRRLVDELHGELLAEPRLDELSSPRQAPGWRHQNIELTNLLLRDDLI